jgi:starvation-inducible DNA-binding protein
MESTVHLQHSKTITRDSRTPEDLRPLLADLFVFYVKTKNIHWYLSHWYLSRADIADCGRLLDEQSTEIRALTQSLEVRARAAGCDPCRSIGWTEESDRLRNMGYTDFEGDDGLSALRASNRRLAQLLRFAHVVLDAEHDTTAAKLIEEWIEETECRDWFLLKSDPQTSCRDFALLSETRQGC